MSGLFYLFLCFRSYPVKLEAFIPTFYKIRSILEELCVAKSDSTYFGTSGPKIRSVRLELDYVTPKPKETSVTTCRRP